MPYIDSPALTRSHESRSLNAYSERRLDPAHDVDTVEENSDNMYYRDFASLFVPS